MRRTNTFDLNPGKEAEEYGIRVRRGSKRGASSKCPVCGSGHVVKRGRLFKCMECEIEAHRDAVGSVNIGLAQGEVIPAGVDRAVTRPFALQGGEDVRGIKGGRM